MALKPIIVTIRGKTDQFRGSMKESIKLINHLAATQRKLAKQRETEERKLARMTEALGKAAIKSGQQAAKAQARTIKESQKLQEQVAKRQMQLQAQSQKQATRDADKRFKEERRMMRQAEQEASRNVKRAAQERLKAERDVIKQIARANKEEDRRRLQAAKETARRDRQVLKEREKAEKEIIKQIARAHKEEDRRRLQAAKEMVRRDKQILKEREKAERDSIRATVRETLRERAKARDMITVGRSITSRVSSPIANIFSGSFRALEEFERQMVNATSIMTITEKQTESLRDKAKALSRTWRVSATEIAEAYIVLASAGQSYSDIIENIETLSKFAVAAQMNLVEATELLVDSTAALGLEAKDYMRVGNALIVANQVAQASVKDYAYALRTELAGSLRVMNIELEEGMALLAAYAKVGYRGAAAGRLASRFIRLLMQTSVTSAEEHRKLGFSIFDTDKRFIGFSRSARELNKIIKEGDAPQRAWILNMLGFKAKTQASALPLLQMADAIDDFQSKIETAGEIIDTVANDQMKGFAAEVDLARNAAQEAAINLGESWQYISEQIIKALTGVFQWFSDLNPLIKMIISSLLALTASIGPLVISLGLMSLAWRAIAWGAIGAGIKATILWMRSLQAVVVGLQLTIAIGLAYAIVRLIGHMSGLAKEADNVWEAINRLKGENERELFEVAKRTEDIIQSFRKQAGAITGSQEEQLAGREKLLESMEKEKSKAESMLKVYEDSATHLQQTLDTVDTSILGRGWHAGNRAAAEGFKTSIVHAKAQQELLKKRIALIDNITKRMKDQKGILQDPFVGEEAAKVIEDLLEQIREVRMGTAEGTLLEFRMRGLSEFDLDNMRHLFEELEKGKEVKENVKTLTEAIKSLKDEIGEQETHLKLGSSLEGIPEELHDIVVLIEKFRGDKELSPLVKKLEEVLPHAIKMRKQFEMMEGSKKTITDLETPFQKLTQRVKELNEQFDAGGFGVHLVGEIRLARGLKEAKKEFEDAMGITKLIEETRTPLEIFNEEVRKLKELKAGDLIDQDLFDRGLKLAKTRFDEATDSIKKMRNEIESLNAVVAGSGDHYDMLLKQLGDFTEKNEKISQDALRGGVAGVAGGKQPAGKGGGVAGFFQDAGGALQGQAIAGELARGQRIVDFFAKQNILAADKMEAMGNVADAEMIRNLATKGGQLGGKFGPGGASNILAGLQEQRKAAELIRQGGGKVPGGGALEILNQQQRIRQAQNAQPGPIGQGMEQEMRQAFNAMRMGADPGSFFVHDTHVEEALKSVAGAVKRGGEKFYGGVPASAFKQGFGGYQASDAEIKEYMRQIEIARWMSERMSQATPQVESSVSKETPSNMEKALTEASRSYRTIRSMEDLIGGSLGGFGKQPRETMIDTIERISNENKLGRDITERSLRGAVGNIGGFKPPTLMGGMSGAAGGSTVGISMQPQSRAEKFNLSNTETLKVLQDIRDGVKKMSDKPGLNLFGVEIS